LDVITTRLSTNHVVASDICDLLHQNESHVANAVFELADDKRQRGDIYHF